MKTLTLKILEPDAMNVIQDLADHYKVEIQNDEKKEKKERGFGSMKGLVIHMSDDFDEPLEDFKDYM